MRKIIVSNLISIDGYFEGQNQDISWFITSADFFDFAAKQLQEVDAILFGRITYQMMAAYWPYAENDDVIKEKMNSLQKIVFSKTLEKVEWNNSKLIKDDLGETIKRIKQQPGKDIVIFGSGTIVSELTNLKLIDEYRLIINPVILGNGNFLFKSLNEKFNLKLTDVKKLDSGSVILYYQLEN